MTNPPTKLQKEIHALIRRWDQEWNISHAELVGALSMALFDLLMSRWTITEEPLVQDVDDEMDDDDDDELEGDE